MKRREVTIYIDAPQEEWDRFLATIEETEVRLAALELEARRVAASDERLLPAWLQRVMEDCE